MKSPEAVEDVVFGDGRLSIEDLSALSTRRRRARLSTAPEFVSAINRGAELIDRLLREDGVQTHESVRELVPELGEDRPLEPELRELLRQVRRCAFEVYPGDSVP